MIAIAGEHIGSVVPAVHRVVDQPVVGDANIRGCPSCGELRARGRKNEPTCATSPRGGAIRRRYSSVFNGSQDRGQGVGGDWPGAVGAKGRLRGLLCELLLQFRNKHALRSRTSRTMRPVRKAIDQIRRPDSHVRSRQCCPTRSCACRHRTHSHPCHRRHYVQVFHARFSRAASSIAYGINDAGQVVGGYGDPATNHGFLYTNGTFSTVDAPDAIAESAIGINNVGPDRRRLLSIIGLRAGGFPAHGRRLHRAARSRGSLYPNGRNQRCGPDRRLL